jgi:predicted phosphodiesterase
MRIAAISDIHGNLPALEAVLAEIGLLGVDAIVNLGDILSGPLWPRETAQRLMALDLPTIAGNHERQVLTQPIDRQSATDAHTSRTLGAAERTWLASLPAALRPFDGVRCCHGTPASDLHYLMETVTADFGQGTSRGLRAATAQEIAERMGRIEEPVLLCGHSHLPRAVEAAGVLVVNPGSVGLPAYDDDLPHRHWVENGTPHARWALIEQAEHRGPWQAHLRRTAYDWEAAARQAQTHGRPDWADALRTGRVGRTEAEALR